MVWGNRKETDARVYMRADDYTVNNKKINKKIEKK